jgi:hypothetical protein
VGMILNIRNKTAQVYELFICGYFNVDRGSLSGGLLLFFLVLALLWFLFFFSLSGVSFSHNCEN